MKNQTFSHSLLHILGAIVLITALAMGAISEARATVPYTVIGWGSNYSGESDIPAGLTDVVAIEAGVEHSLALKSDGTIVAWGNNEYGQATVPSGLGDVVAIAAGDFYNLALKGDGTVVSWGDNRWGQIDVPPGLTGVTAIAAGMGNSMALKADGTVIAWGWYGNDINNIPDGLADVVAIAVGFDHALALKSDGTVAGWGIECRLCIPSGLSGVVAIAAGGFHSLALKSDGTVASWGGGGYFNPADIPAGLGGVVAIDAGYYHNVALKSDGTVVVWGGWLEDPGFDTSGLSGVLDISAGGWHNLALVPPAVLANTAPTANPGGPYLGAVNTAISFDGSLSSDPESDPLTYAWTFGDGSAAGTGVNPAHSYTTAGIYNACLTVNDGALSSLEVCTIAVVYDPSAGFVTGGGWINSPTGAFLADPTLEGHATFGFIAKYQKGASLPMGTTAFQFDLAGLAFSSTSYEWLVVNQAGANAQFKGSGTLNGALDPDGNGYKFMLWAADGSSANSADTFRIRIWWEGAGGIENVVYDNGVNQAIGAGNIVVHNNK